MKHKKRVNWFAPIVVLIMLVTIATGGAWIHHTRTQVLAQKQQLEEQRLHWQTEEQKIQEEINYLQQFLPAPGEDGR